MLLPLVHIDKQAICNNIHFHFFYLKMICHTLNRFLNPGNLRTITKQCFPHADDQFLHFSQLLHVFLISDCFHIV